MTKKKKKIILRCERIEADVPNANNRIYTRETLQHMVDRVNEAGPKRRMFGTLGQSDSNTGATKMDDASHLVLSADLDGDNHVSAEIEVLDTPPGKALEDLLASGRAEIVPVGIGSVMDGIVGPDYKLIRFDIVSRDQ